MLRGDKVYEQVLEHSRTGLDHGEIVGVAENYWRTPGTVTSDGKCIFPGGLLKKSKSYLC